MKKVWGKNVCENAEEILRNTKAAVLVIDIQNDLVHPEGHFAKNDKNIDLMKEIIPNVKEFLTEIRKYNLPIIYIQQTTLPDGKSDSSSWLKLKTRDKKPNYTIEGSWGQKIIDEIKPKPNDLIVNKFRPDAFVNTSLNQILQCCEIETLIILGVVTQGCVESTVRGASYHDYYTIVIEDCVASTNKIMHLNSIKFMKSRYDVLKYKKILKIMERVKK